MRGVLAYEPTPYSSHSNFSQKSLNHRDHLEQIHGAGTWNREIEQGHGGRT